MSYLSSIVEVNLKKENKIHLTKWNQNTIFIAFDEVENAF